MAVANEIGKATLARIKSKTIMGTLVTGAAVAGLSKGLQSQDLSRASYDMITGNPDIDQAVFGTKIGLRELLAPIPLPSTRINAMKRGGFTGLTAGVSSGLINGTSVSDMNRDSNQPMVGGLRYANRPPQVNGSLVFGQYNARYG